VVDANVSVQAVLFCDETVTGVVPVLTFPVQAAKVAYSLLAKVIVSGEFR
jgi:hypothetical protein